MTNSRLARVNVSRGDRADEFTWAHQWSRVPKPWRNGFYRLDTAPHNEVFVRNANYLRSEKHYEFVPAENSRLRNECAWWLWSIWADGSRKIDPAMLAWWGRSITALAQARASFATSGVEVSTADFEPALVVREALRAFEKRNGRYPSPGNTRNLESAAHSIHDHVTVRCSDTPWWVHDTWNMRLDERIPRRQHEPHAERIITLAGIEPTWLREGIRYWISQALLLDMYTWTTACARVTSVGSLFGAFCRTRSVTGPAVAEDLAGVRGTFMEYLAYLRSPEATSTGKPLAPSGVKAAQSHVQSFYAFMTDNADAAAQFTGDGAWRNLTVNHTRLWAPSYAPRRAGNSQEIRYYTDTEVGRLIAHLPVLAAPTSETITIDHAGTSDSFTGLGDPQAARAWEIQTLTGRRASEVLMLNREPLTMLDLGDGPASGSGARDAFVARLRYQQTKVDGVDPTILVQQAVVNIVDEQQNWLAQHMPEAADGPYLFPQMRGNYRGLRPRAYRSYADALKRLNKAVNLVDDSGRPLVYTQTRRLRHTRATNLLNAGVPVHVVMRYLGHKSPEMTMRYAATLAVTEEAEFLKYKKIGADGQDLNIAPRDLLDIAQLDQRADRILPNGLCLLPPTQSCDKGNACLPCGSFATDQSHLPEHRAHRAKLLALIDTRKATFEARHGQPMPETNIWLTARLREIASLEAIIERLEAESSDDPVTGAGTTGRTALTLVTDPSTRNELREQLNARNQ